ncbi:hypothetical protein [Ignavibacterium sp.]|jgi:hypothetical protein|uniref:hypothetical protein n=1 Tax=Ignavibacterium sp. TaxID=2651167 RepID=UPI0025BBB12B|nr:hypothetical protein [Ignavibacterium sp.]
MANSINKKKLLISCKEATMLSVQKAEINLSFTDRMRLFIHLLICQYCRLFDKQIKMIDTILSTWNTNKKLTNDQKTALQAIIDKELN